MCGTNTPPSPDPSPPRPSRPRPSRQRSSRPFKADLYGSIEPNGNNWRAALKIGGTYSKGPTRAAREEAVEDLRALNLARPRGLHAVAACAGALQANASARCQARSASSTTQSGRTEEPSSQLTAVHASPPVGLDTRVCTGAQPSIAAPELDEEFPTAYYTPKKRQNQLQAETFRPRPYRPSRPPSKNPSPLSPRTFRPSPSRPRTSAQGPADSEPLDPDPPGSRPLFKTPQSQTV